MEQTFENLKIRGKYGESLFACCEIYYYYQNVQSFCVYMYVKISPWMWKYQEYYCIILFRFGLFSTDTTQLI